MVKRKTTGSTMTERELIAQQPTSGITVGTTDTTSSMAATTAVAVNNNRHRQSSSPSSIFHFESLQENVDVFELIIEFVGPYQYLFVATINQSFHEAHSIVFRDDSTTILNASTVALAKYCFNDLMNDSSCPDCVYSTYTEECQYQLCSSAAKYGNLAALLYLRAVGCQWDPSTCSNAALHGNFAILKWARENGCAWDEMTCSNAALRGHLHILQWARENECPWNTLTCENAASNGLLNILQWANEKDCPWGVGTCAKAAEHGHLPVLQWARENECPWDKRTCENAARN